jgi:hypothetical protein
MKTYLSISRCCPNFDFQPYLSGDHANFTTLGVSEEGILILHFQTDLFFASSGVIMCNTTRTNSVSDAQVSTPEGPDQIKGWEHPHQGQIPTYQP